MEENRSPASDLDFLRSQWYVLNNAQFDAWMSTPEFTKKIRSRIDSGEFVSRRDALEIMRDTYTEIKSKYSSRSFGAARIKAMKNSINRMERFVKEP